MEVAVSGGMGSPDQLRRKQEAMLLATARSRDRRWEARGG